MTKQRYSMVAVLATTIVGTSFAGNLAAQDQVNIDTIARQFHVNYSNDKVEINGALVDDNLVVRRNGKAGTAVNGAIFRGRKAFVAWLKRGRVMFSDGKITDHDVVVSGNMAAIRFTLEGTHTGPIATPNGTLPATGRKVRIEGTEFLTFNSSGKLTPLETLTNDLSVIGQLTAK